MLESRPVPPPLLLRLRTIFVRRLVSLVVIIGISSIAVTAEPPPASSPLCCIVSSLNGCFPQTVSVSRARVVGSSQNFGLGRASGSSRPARLTQPATSGLLQVGPNSGITSAMFLNF